MRTSFFFLGSFLAGIVAAGAATVSVDSTIESVEVYQGQALVTRSFTAELEAGDHTLVFHGLPTNVDMATARLAIESGQLHLGSVTQDRHFTPADESERLRELRRQLEALETEKAARQHDRKIAGEFAAHHTDLLQAIRDGIRETGERGLFDLAREAWPESVTAQRESFEAISELNERIKELDREIPEARRKFQERLNQERRAASKLSVSVRAGGGSVQGVLRYVVAGAGWAPAYQIRAIPGETRIEAVYQASVYQTTGEDWTDVRLSLSTGQPAAGGAPAEPGPIFLRQWEAEKRALRSVPSPQMALSSREMAAFASADQSEPPPVTIAVSTTGFEAVLPGRASVPALGEPVVLPLLEAELPAEFWSVTVPLTAEAAFLMARFDNPFELPMLPGRAQLFVDGRMSGFSEVEETLPGQELELGLGENPNIEVKRIILAEDASRSGIISRTRNEDRRYRVEVVNRMPVTQRVVIKERVPISRDERIKVDLRAPRGAEIDPETGLFEVEMDLAPGERAESLTHFTVSYPHDWEVTPGW